MDQFRNMGEPPTFSSQPQGLSEYYRNRTQPDNGGYGMQNAGGAQPQSRPAAQTQPPKQQEQWMVAMNGQQYGPYEPRLIEGMIKSRQIDSAQAYAWKQGMPNWVPFQQVPELAALVAPPVAAPPTPPIGGGAPGAPSAPTAPSASSAPVAPSTPAGVVNSVPRGASSSMGSPSFGTPTASAPMSASAQVDLNNATVDQLLTLPEFTLPLAEQFVAERGQRGGFQSVEQAAQFLNLKPHQADKLARTAVLKPYQGTRPSTGDMSSTNGNGSSAPASGRVVEF